MYTYAPILHVWIHSKCALNEYILYPYMNSDQINDVCIHVCLLLSLLDRE